VRLGNYFVGDRLRQIEFTREESSLFIVFLPNTMKKTNSKKWICFGPIALLVLLWVEVSPVLADMYIQGNDPTPNPQRYSRFYAGDDKAFIGAGLDFSGVSISGPWATMISPQYFITAYHWPATDQTQLSFCEGNSYASGIHTYDVDSTFHVSMTYNGEPVDVYLGRLTTPIPESDHISYYPILTLPNTSDYVGMTIYNYGNPNTVGRNVISKIEPYAEGGEDGLGMFFNYDDPGLGSDETYLIGGDSGLPSFAVVDGKLALLGEHFSTYGTSGLIPFDGGSPKASDGSWWSVDGFIPAYIDQLNAVLPLDQQVTTVAPEPGTLAMLGIFAVMAFSIGRFARRRKSA
jgi:hypothetical protein